MNESPFRKRLTLELLRKGADYASQALRELNESDAAAGIDISNEPVPEPYELLLLGLAEHLKLVDAPESERSAEEGDDSELIRLIGAIYRTPHGVSDIPGLLRLLQPVASAATTTEPGWFSLDYLDLYFKANDGQLWFLDGTRMKPRASDN